MFVGTNNVTRRVYVYAVLCCGISHLTLALALALTLEHLSTCTFDCASICAKMLNRTNSIVPPFLSSFNICLCLSNFFCLRFAVHVLNLMWSMTFVWMLVMLCRMLIRRGECIIFGISASSTPSLSSPFASSATTSGSRRSNFWRFGLLLLWQVWKGTVKGNAKKSKTHLVCCCCCGKFGKAQEKEYKTKQKVKHVCCCCCCCGKFGKA